MRRRFIQAAIVGFLAVAPLRAHPVPFSYLDLRVDRTGVSGWLVDHIEDAANLGPPLHLSTAGSPSIRRL
ncbi:MAG: hypothetical protein FJ303_21665 [Planctomycetes bacterium]|nr:hypothetical protein [Planctomycetota bacterium]